MEISITTRSRSGSSLRIRTTFAADGELNATKKVGYVKLPHDLEDEIMIDIESGVTISIGDMCVLII